MSGGNPALAVAGGLRGWPPTPAPVSREVGRASGEQGEMEEVVAWDCAAKEEEKKCSLEVEG